MIQDKPYLRKKKDFKSQIKKTFIFNLAKFYPTSCIALKKKFFLKYLKYLKKNEIKNLEIDSRLVIYSFLTNNLNIIHKSLTIYNYDNLGITSNYKKFSLSWWKKRFEAFEYFKYLSNRLNVKFKKGPDYYLTVLINKLYNLR